MPRQKRLNTIYISERLQEKLRPIAHSRLTTVVAPMGYGKTTAVNWYLAQRTRTEDAAVVRISVYSDNLAIFWRSVQEAFDHAGFPSLRDYECPADDAGASLLTDGLCRALAGGRPCYIFIDDFHLLSDRRVAGFLCTLAARLPENVRLIVAGRDRFLPSEEILRLGGRVCRIGTEELRLNHTELSVYARRCGAELTDQQVEELLHTSEGWFSAVYLGLQSLTERGGLPDGAPDIYTMFSAAMIDPLPPRRRAFLAMMGLADEFTVEMACAVTEDETAQAQLAALTEQNAFVTRLPDGVTYRFHHMMKACARRTFHTLPQETQTACLRRYGRWYESHGLCLHALAVYQDAGDYDGLLRVVEQDAGILLASLEPERVLDSLDRCPEQALKAHPLALLVLMRSMFNWRRIPRMMALKSLLLAAIEEHPDMPAAEKGDLLGECDLIMSFLCYNDIAAMSRLHRSASARMSRPAVTIRRHGGWTFGSPSVLMMFHRQPGQLDRELAEMADCMPHYYKITDGHGQGAERIMRAEAAFLQGRIVDAQIELERAYAQIHGNGQENMALCCDFLAWRLSLCTGEAPRRTMAQRRQELLRQHNAAWLHILDATAAYYGALTGETEEIPPVFREHRLASLSLLAPGRPMLEMIDNQVLLAQGAWAKVIGRSAALLETCAAMHYALVALHVRLQTAAAYAQLGKRREARELLAQALADGEKDGFVLPFVENYRYLKELLPELGGGLARQGVPLGEDYEKRCRDLLRRGAAPASFSVLTEREREVALLVAARLSNREIAEQLFLSEGSVKQYVNRIYAKLFIEGDTRTKRRRLADMARR